MALTCEKEDAFPLGGEEEGEEEGSFVGSEPDEVVVGEIIMEEDIIELQTEEVIAVKSTPILVCEPSVNCLFCYGPVLKFNSELAKCERQLMIKTSERMFLYVCKYLEFDESAEEFRMTRKSKSKGETRLLPGNLPLCLKCRMLYYHKIYDAFVQYEMAMDSLHEKITACITQEIATSAKKNPKSVEVNGGEGNWSGEGADSIFDSQLHSAKEHEVMTLVKQFRKKIAEKNPTGYYTEETRGANKKPPVSLLSEAESESDSNSAANPPAVAKFKNVIHVVKTHLADELVKSADDKQKETVEHLQGIKQTMESEVFEGITSASSSKSKEPFGYYAVANPSPGIIQIIPMKKPIGHRGQKRTRREPHYMEHRLKQNTCKFCNKLMPYPAALTKHMVDEHGMEKPEKCPKCDYRCIQKGSLEKHMQTHLEDSERVETYQCDECGKAYKTKQSLRVHMSEHNGSRPLFTCDICGKQFKNRDSKKVCIEKHNGIKKFECLFANCGKRFLRREVLKAHQRTHTGEKPYKCQICGKQFSQASPLRTHLKNIHHQ